MFDTTTQLPTEVIKFIKEKADLLSLSGKDTVYHYFPCVFKVTADLVEIVVLRGDTEPDYRELAKWHNGKPIIINESNK